MSYLKTEPAISSFGYHKYDVYNPFSQFNFKPSCFSGNSSEYISLTRDLRAKPNDSFERLRNQNQLIQRKEREYHQILYGEKRMNDMKNSTKYLAKHQLIQMNPFLTGQSQNLKQLKLKQAEAKAQFFIKTERQNQWKNDKVSKKQQNQQFLRDVLSKKQFKTILELKNLQDYRRIKQVQKLKKQSQTDRKNLLNYEANKATGQGLFSFANQQSKKFGLKTSSKFSRSLEQEQDMRITFSKNLKQSRQQGFTQMRRPPLMKKVNDSRNSLQKIQLSESQSPKTIKLKNKTFYLIAL